MYYDNKEYEKYVPHQNNERVKSSIPNTHLQSQHPLIFLTPTNTNLQSQHPLIFPTPTNTHLQSQHPPIFPTPTNTNLQSQHPPIFPTPTYIPNAHQHPPTPPWPTNTHLHSQLGLRRLCRALFENNSKPTYSSIMLA